MVRVLTEINPVLGPVQPCTIRNLQPKSVSHECVYIWKYGLSVCSCESSRKDLQSKQGRRVPEQGGARLIFRCDAEARITKRGEAGCSCALSGLQEQADRRIQRRSQESRNLPDCFSITRCKSHGRSENRPRV